MKELLDPVAPELSLLLVLVLVLAAVVWVVLVVSAGLEAMPHGPVPGHSTLLAWPKHTLWPKENDCLR